MKIIDRKRAAPLLLMLSLAVIGSMLLMMAVTTSGDEAVSAQDCIPADSPLASLPGANVCPEDTPTPTADDCIPPDSPLASLPGANVCPTQTPVPTATTEPTPVPTNTPIPTRTPRPTRTPAPTSTPDPDAPPTATPKATGTPVMVEKVDVTAVEGATTVEPDAQVVLTAGNVTVKFPSLSRARTYQAMLSESDECGNMAAACATLSIYNAEGEMESDVRLISSAEIEVMLDAAAVDAIGGDLPGAAVAVQASALGGIMLQLMDDDSGEWNSIPSTFMVNSDGSAMVTGMTRRFSHIALMVYDDVVEQARMQVSMALGTPTATPVPPTATPAPPTATPVPPTPTPEPTPVPPDTGDPSVPFLMLLAMAVAASMAALVGTKVIMARVRR